ncbi:MAG: pentapeptide repeat-containing protein [Pseudomonadota bacterium]
MENNSQSQIRSDVQFLKTCISTKDIPGWNAFNASLAADGKTALLEGLDLSQTHLGGFDFSKAHLRGTNFSGAHLEGVDFSGSNLENVVFTAAHLEGADFGGANLEKAVLIGAYLTGVNLDFANLTQTDFSYANLEGLKLRRGNLGAVNFSYANLEGSDFSYTQFERVVFHGASMAGSIFSGSDLTGANFRGAGLANTNMRGAILRNADLSSTHIEGAIFSKTNIVGAVFNLAICDAGTLFSNCNVDKKTDFRSVGLDNARFSPGLKELLKYNNRRLNWEEWSLKNKYSGAMVRAFWGFSDYGRSTRRIIWWFLGFSLVFAVLYCYIPDMVEGFDGDGGTGGYVGFARFIRALYFSFVTMTTLGFGDMCARKTISAVMDPAYWRTILGHCLIMMQVIVGYVILGALVTRLSMLFTSEDAPLARFEDD